MDEEENDFQKRIKDFLGDFEETERLSEQEIIQEIKDNIVSMMDDGTIYVHAGHFEELSREIAGMIREVTEAFGDDAGELPGKIIGYVLGLAEVLRLVQLFVQALIMKHSDDIELPVDELVEGFNKILRGDEE